MNLYLGVDYLNEFFYTMPDAQCSTPIAIASAFKKNDLACGTKYARRRLSMKKKDGSLTKSSTALRKKYCFVTPESPQEKYYECKTDPPTCVTNSLAAGQAVRSFVASSFRSWKCLLFILACLIDHGPTMNPHPQRTNA